MYWEEHNITELLARRGVFLQATHKGWVEVGSERAVAAAIAMHISTHHVLPRPLFLPLT